MGVGEGVDVGVGADGVGVATSVASTFVGRGVGSSLRRQAARGRATASITIRAKVTRPISLGQVYEVAMPEVRGRCRKSLV